MKELAPDWLPQIKVLTTVIRPTKIRMWSRNLVKIVIRDFEIRCTAGRCGKVRFWLPPRESYVLYINSLINMIRIIPPNEPRPRQRAAELTL